MTNEQWAAITGIGHIRLTVTEIQQSRHFYRQLFGSVPVIDFSDQVDVPGTREDPDQFYGGCVFQIGEQLLGLRPAAAAGDRFEPTRVGLDHLSFTVESVEDLRAAADRLQAAGVPHGRLKELPDAGMAIVSVQDPDDINVELVADLP